MAQRRPRSSSPNNIDSFSEDGYAKRPFPAEIAQHLYPEMSNTMLCSDMICPICYETIKDAYITPCGHSFCHVCIIKSVERYKKCPKCCSAIVKEQVHQNILLNEVILKCKIKNSTSIVAQENNQSVTEHLKKYILEESKNLNLADTNQMIDILLQHKQKIEIESNTAQHFLLFEFLKKLLKQKEEDKSKILNEINIIKKDLEFTKKTIANHNEKQLSLKSVDSVDSSGMMTSFDETNNSVSEINENFQSKMIILNSNFDDLVSSYLGMQSINSLANFNSHKSEINDTLKTSRQEDFPLNSFREILAKCCRYSTFKCRATVNSASDDYITSNIVSSIVFDKDNTHFAIGGVTKRIKIYDISLVETNMSAFQYPLIQMILSNKISCLSWNHLHKNVLASSDYEGIVNIWDVDTGTRTRCFNEHEKRCWSVDFNEIDSNLLVSGSDDNTVKLWSLKENNSIATLEAKANVCCVKFNPKSSYHLAFGSADHYIHYYDLRNMKNSLCTFKGHKKAVSYVKFLNSKELISASTDSQLKYWDINSPGTCLRSFKGHINEKNFVGLATDRDYIACGSEDNSVYIYHKGISKQLFSYKINIPEGALDLERLNEMNEFVSAVCWKKNSDIILAANSRGLIKVLELI